MTGNNFFRLILSGLLLLLFTGCGFNSNKDENDSSKTESVISEELHQAHCDLLAQANERLAVINQKVRDLNDKIQNGAKLTDEQNADLDKFEAKQTSINKRMHEIKNVPQENWENFKSTFEKDLEEVEALINKVLEEFK